MNEALRGCPIWPSRQNGDVAVGTAHGTGRYSLTERARTMHGDLQGRLEEQRSPRSWSGPLQGARRTCRLAASGRRYVVPDLMEWDYGDYEGRLTSDIRRDRPGWYLFRDGAPGVSRSRKWVCSRRPRWSGPVRSDGGRILLFGHGHFLPHPRHALVGPVTEDAEALSCQYRSGFFWSNRGG